MGQVDAEAFGNLDQPSGSKQAQLYTGEYWDQDAQLLYLRARWYDPKMGRFISADPFEGKQSDPRSLNRYTYAHGDSINLVDRTGLLTTQELQIAGTAVGIGATLGAVSSVLHNQALGRATHVQDVLIGASAGAAVGAFAVVAPLAATAIGLWGVYDSGALVANVWTDEISTPKQQAAASVLLLTAVAGTGAGYQLAAKLGPLGRGNGILHDDSVGAMVGFLRAMGLTVRTEVRVPNPFYSPRSPRRYDFAVKKPNSEEWIAFEWKSSRSAYLRQSKQTEADAWVNEHGGTIRGTNDRVTSVIKLNGGATVPPPCVGEGLCNR